MFSQGGWRGGVILRKVLASVGLGPSRPTVGLSSNPVPIVLLLLLLQLGRFTPTRAKKHTYTHTYTPPCYRPYPLRTVIVGKGKAAQAQEALKAMRRTELIPPDCHIDVVEGCGPRGADNRQHGPRAGLGGRAKQQQQEEEKADCGEDGGRSRSFFGSCSMLLMSSPVLRTIFGRWGWLSGGPRDLQLARCVCAGLLC